MSDISGAKNQLRAEMKARRAALAAVPDAGERLAKAIAQSLEVEGSVWPRGGIVSGYWPIGSEIDPRPVMHYLAGRGYELALPVLLPEAGGYAMEFRRWADGDDLLAGPMRISQPSPEAPACWPDILLTPLLAFDGFGYRLGYGGGHYDRALSFLRGQKRCMAVGIAFAGQQLDRVPREPFDQPLDAVFTEQGPVALNPGI